MRKAVFTFELGPERNEAVLAALRPEASREIPRAQASVRLEGGRLHLEISAEDSASLRAAVNSYLRWVNVAAEAADAGARAKNGKDASSGEKAPAGNTAKGRNAPKRDGARMKSGARRRVKAEKIMGAPRGRARGK